MAMKHFLAVYPKPEDPTTYTGLFTTRTISRAWNDKPNKSINGVSYTLYGDAYRISCGPDASLFDFIHGRCAEFAYYFHEQNPDWKIVDMRRGNFWDSLIHSYCIKEIGGITYFADARGITDDPEEFFADFACSKDMHVEDYIPEEDEAVEEEVKKAYELIFGDEPILTKVA